MVETGATGRSFPGFETINEDLKPLQDAVKNLGAADKRWLALYAVIAVLTSLTISGIYLGATAGGELLVNASAIINGSLTVTQNISLSDNYICLNNACDKFICSNSSTILISNNNPGMGC